MSSQPMEISDTKSRYIASKENDELLLWLARHPLDQVPRDTTGKVYAWKVGDVMVVRSDEKVTSVLKKLATETFLSAPVMRNGQYEGYVDMLDIVRFVSDLFQGETEEEWTDFFEKQDDFRLATVDQIMQSPGWGLRRSPVNPFQPVIKDMSLLTVWEILSKSSQHRVAILNREHELTGIMTHSMCISMIRQNMARFECLKKVTVADALDDLNRKVLTVKESATAREAFEKIAENNVGGLAVVDDDDVLVGSISIMDLRGVGFTGASFRRLYATVKDYKEMVRKEFPRQAPDTHYSNKRVPVSAISVTPENTLADVVDLYNDGNLHRVFVVDTESHRAGRPKVTHVMTQQDLLRQCVIRLGVPLL